MGTGPVHVTQLPVQPDRTRRNHLFLVRASPVPRTTETRTPEKVRATGSIRGRVRWRRRWRGEQPASSRPVAASRRSTGRLGRDHGHDVLRSRDIGHDHSLRAHGQHDGIGVGYDATDAKRRRSALQLDIRETERASTARARRWTRSPNCGRTQAPVHPTLNPGGVGNKVSITCSSIVDGSTNE